jgi:hypothetical protein
VNYPVQSSASDVVFNSVIDIWNRKEEADMKSVFLASVHDSIEYDVYPGELITMMNLFRQEGQETIAGKYPWLTCPLKMDFEIGVSWGGALKCEVKHLDDKRAVLKAKGLRKDFKQMQLVAQRAYNCTIDNIEETALQSKDFKDDVLFRDSARWKATVTLELK